MEVTRRRVIQFGAGLIGLVIAEAAEPFAIMPAEADDLPLIEIGQLPDGYRATDLFQVGGGFAMTTKHPDGNEQIYTLTGTEAGRNYELLEHSSYLFNRGYDGIATMNDVGEVILLHTKIDGEEGYLLASEIFYDDYKPFRDLETVLYAAPMAGHEALVVVGTNREGGVNAKIMTADYNIESPFIQGFDPNDKIHHVARRDGGLAIYAGNKVYIESRERRGPANQEIPVNGGEIRTFRNSGDHAVIVNYDSANPYGPMITFVGVENNGNVTLEEPNPTSFGEEVRILDVQGRENMLLQTDDKRVIWYKHPSGGKPWADFVDFGGREIDQAILMTEGYNQFIYAVTADGMVVVKQIA
jgi:hypothetical protein